MVLIAATALSVACVRRTLQVFVQWDLLRFDSLENGMVSIGFALAQSVSATMAAATFGMVGIRLIRPRPSMQRLARQPGAVAGWAVVIATALMTFDSRFLAALYGGYGPSGLVSDYPLKDGLFDRLLSTLISSNSINGYAVVVAWTIQALGRRFRPEKSWIDRLGRGCGIFWLVMIPTNTLLNWYSIYLLMSGKGIPVKTL